MLRLCVISATPMSCSSFWLIVLGFNDTRAILYCLPEKGGKEIEEIVEEMKERDREETEEIKKNPPSTLTCYKDSRPCPAVSRYQ